MSSVQTSPSKIFGQILHRIAETDIKWKNLDLKFQSWQGEFDSKHSKFKFSDGKTELVYMLKLLIHCKKWSENIITEKERNSLSCIVLKAGSDINLEEKQTSIEECLEAMDTQMSILISKTISFVPPELQKRRNSYRSSLLWQ